MPRLPLAATTLISDALAYADRHDFHSDVTIDRVGDVDGLGVIRGVRFDTTTAEWLYPLLKTIDDHRVAALRKDAYGLLVTFVGTTKADTREHFPLVDAAYVLGLQEATVPETGEVADLDHPLTPDEPS